MLCKRGTLIARLCAFGMLQSVLLTFRLFRHLMRKHGFSDSNFKRRSKILIDSNYGDETCARLLVVYQIWLNSVRQSNHPFRMALSGKSIRRRNKPFLRWSNGVYQDAIF